jgi:hypothetical protein
MKCTRVEKFLPLHVAGDLAGRRARAVENHLAACEPCRHHAAGYRATRALLSRAATLPADFDGAFYEAIRNSVLAQIRHDRTLAPPVPRRFPILFGARPAYAASLALLFVAAALALHSYTLRAPEDGGRQREIAAANGERRTHPANPSATRTPVTKTPSAIKTPHATRPGSVDHSPPRPADEFARGAAGAGRRAAKSLPPRSDGKVENARNGSSPGLDTTQPTPTAAAQNPPAPAVVATASRANAEEVAATNTTTGAGGGAQTAAAPEVSRIEIQTSDPNIRIIWLSPPTEDPARPLQ